MNTRTSPARKPIPPSVAADALKPVLKIAAVVVVGIYVVLALGSGLAGASQSVSPQVVTLVVLFVTMQLWICACLGIIANKCLKE